MKYIETLANSKKKNFNEYTTRTNQLMTINHNEICCSNLIVVRRIMTERYVSDSLSYIQIALSEEKPWLTLGCTIFKFISRGSLNDLKFCEKPRTRKSVVKRIRNVIKIMCRARIDTAICLIKTRAFECIEKDKRHFETFCFNFHLHNLNRLVLN